MNRFMRIGSIAATIAAAIVAVALIAKDRLTGPAPAPVAPVRAPAARALARPQSRPPASPKRSEARSRSRKPKAAASRRRSLRDQRDRPGLQGQTHQAGHQRALPISPGPTRRYWPRRSKPRSPGSRPGSTPPGAAAPESSALPLSPGGPGGPAPRRTVLPRRPAPPLALPDPGARGRRDDQSPGIDPRVHHAPVALHGRRGAGGRRRTHRQVAVQGTRRRRHRVGADGVPVPGDAVHLEPGGVRHGLHLLRHRAVRVRAAPVGGRDRRPGRLRQGPPQGPSDARFARAPRQRGVHGHGRAAGQLRPGARGDPAHGGGHGHVGPQHHGVHGRLPARDAETGRGTVAGHPGPQPPRRRRRPARAPGAVEPPLPDRRPDRRRRRLPAHQGPPGDPGVDSHGGRQRHRRAGDGAGRRSPPNCGPTST